MTNMQPSSLGGDDSIVFSEKVTFAPPPFSGSISRGKLGERRDKDAARLRETVDMEVDGLPLHGLGFPRGGCYFDTVVRS